MLTLSSNWTLQCEGSAPDDGLPSRSSRSGRSRPRSKTLAGLDKYLTESQAHKAYIMHVTGCMLLNRLGLKCPITGTISLSATITAR
jgi:hypothetical protein